MWFGVLGNLKLQYYDPETVNLSSPLGSVVRGFDPIWPIPRPSAESYQPKTKVEIITLIPISWASIQDSLLSAP